MKQTAVEWLVEEINKINVSTEARIFINKLEKQAKEMEKQQQGYSEEEVIKILYQFHYDLVNSNFDTKEEWFEKFKNK